MRNPIRECRASHAGMPSDRSRPASADALGLHAATRDKKAPGPPRSGGFVLLGRLASFCTVRADLGPDFVDGFHGLHGNALAEFLGDFLQIVGIA